MLRLAARLNIDSGLRRDLSRALECDDPCVEQLLAAGLPRYRADELYRLLDQAGEITCTGWDPEVRAGYRALLHEPEAPQRRLRELPDHLRPRERARWYGIERLADAELLAVLLRTGGSEGVLEMAERLLRDHDGLLGLADRDVAELARQHGLGPAKATEIAAAFELGRRIAAARRAVRPVLRTPEQVAEIMRHDLVPLDHEQFWCLPLDTRSRLVGEPRMVSKGDVDGTDAAARTFFRIALRANASSAVAVHNHPTGDPGVSPADVAVTRSLLAAGRLIGIPLVDHVVLGEGGELVSLRRCQGELWSAG